MAETGATVSLDIERARTDAGYWGEQMDAGNIPIDYIRGGNVPAGFSGPTDNQKPLYLNDGPNPLVGSNEALFNGPIIDEQGNAVLGNPTGSYDEVGVTMGQGNTGGVTGGGSTGSTYDDGPLRVSRNQTPPAEDITPNEAAKANQQLENQNYRQQALSSMKPSSGAPRVSQSYSDSDPVWRKFYSEVEGRHNVLHDYNSYNYVITLVALSDEQVKNPSSYKGRVITDAGVESDSFYIIAKSGGFERSEYKGTGSITVGGTTYESGERFKSPNGSSSTRNNSRITDLFIDDLIFDTRPGINDMGNSNLTTGRFKITEPHGVGGFYQELYAGAGYAGHANYIGAPFLLVISFIGRRADSDDAEIPDKTTRYIPIMFKGSTMSVNEGGAIYDVEFLGYNASGASAASAALWDDISPVVNPTESVEQIAYSVFYRNHQAHKDALIKMSEGADQETKNEIARRLSDTGLQQQALSGAGLNANTRITQYEAHKYFVWFPPDWQGALTTPPGQWSSSYSWEQSVANMLEQGANFRGPLFGDVSNNFGNAGLNDEITPQFGLLIRPDEEAKEANNNRIREQNRIIDSSTTQFDTEKRSFEAARESLAGILNPTTANESNTSTDLVQDINIQPNTAKEEAAKTIDEATAEAVNLADLALGNTGAPPHISAPQQSNLSPADIQRVTRLREQILNHSQKLKELNQAVVEAQARKTALQEERENIPRQTYDLQSTGVPWQFKKGLNLQSVIDILVTNSQYMTVLQDPGALSQIAESEFIPWYRTDVYTVPIAFDVVTMQPVKEFHYVVSPIDVHYSKMPGVNIIFSTAKLRKQAVREYNYIYTGKNLDVLNFDIKYNNLFTTPLLLRPPNSEALGGQVQRQEVINTTIPRSEFQNAVDSISQGISNKLGESGFTPAQAASEKLTYRDIAITNRNSIGLALKEFLYNPPFEQALIRAEIQIVGDPVYIVGSGISDRPALLKDDILTPDGEINGFSREPDILFKFRTADDIPSSADLKFGLFQQQPSEGEFNGCFQVVKIENRFEEGVFTQTLSTLRRRNQEQDYEVTQQQTATAPANGSQRPAGDNNRTIRTNRTTGSSRPDTVGPDDGFRNNSTTGDRTDGQNP